MQIAGSPRSRRLLASVSLALLVLVVSVLGLAAQTNDAPYVKNVAGADNVLTAMLTVGEDVPRTSNPSTPYRMVGIPDGIGVYGDAQGMAHVLVNHEIANNVGTQPLVGGSPISGTYVSEYIINPATRQVVSGDLAYTTIYAGTQTTPVTGIFSRFCSGALAGTEMGFDRPIYFTGEESSGSATFDGLGGVAIAVLDHNAYILPDLSHFPKENIVPVPGTGTRTVLFGLEDGPTTPDSQLYMYVGTKNPAATHPLEKNGLVGGRLYVFASHDPARSSEATFHKGDGTLAGHWVEIPNAASLNDVQLETASDAAGAFGFVRVEDGSPRRNQPGTLFFATTGSTNPANLRGRLYRMNFDPANPVGGTTSLTVLLEGGTTAGLDPIVNPDNLDINNDGILLLQEDPNVENRGEPLGRDASVWRYNVETANLTRIAEIDQNVVPFTPAPWGTWETSGVHDVSQWFGPGTWLLDVQAHSITSTQASQLQGLSGDVRLAEGGQLLLLTNPTTTAVTLGGLQSGPTPQALTGLLVAGLTLAAAAYLVLRRPAR